MRRYPTVKGGNVQDAEIWSSPLGVKDLEGGRKEPS